MAHAARAREGRAALFAALLALLIAACTRPRPPAVAAATAPRPTFDAAPVDVSVDWQRTPPGPALAAVALTATDGTGIRLSSFDARAVIYGPLAFTELHLTFTNPEARMREGTFSITLPNRASVSRFAMRVGALWQEGEVVEPERARQAYESALQRKIDPALLEQVSGNVFRGRVYPIFGNEKKEVVISYTETLDAGEYRVPLDGLPALDLLDVQVLVPSAKKAFVLHRENEAPKHDFLYAQPDESAVRGGRFAIARIASKPATKDEPTETLAVLIDSSASHATTYDTDVERMATIAEHLDPSLRLEVACFDQEIVPIANVRDAKLRRPGGATNFVAALAWARSKARRAVVVTDGADSVGRSVLASSGLDRVDVVASARADGRGVHELVTNGLRPGAVVSTADDIRTTFVGTTRVELARATHVWPTSLADRGASGMYAVAALELPESAPLAVSIDQAPPRAIEHVDTAPEELVERAVVEAHIRELDRDRAVHSAEIVALSMRHRILTPLTSMVILENDGEYGRFKIPREAMQNIPVVGRNGVEVLPRGGKPMLPPRPIGPAPVVGGSPSIDADGDGIPDAADKCPNEPETMNGYEDDDGCPDRGQVVIESNNITVLQAVYFRPGSAEIVGGSADVIEALALTLLHHHELEVIGVFGHTDATEPAALALTRANVVRDAVAKFGIEKDRLIAKGFGATRPHADNKTEESRARNRRVEFKILIGGGRPTGIEESSMVPSLIRNGKVIPRGHAYTGDFSVAMDYLTRKDPATAVRYSEGLTANQPADMLAWIALGRSLEALGRPKEAARAYGSLLDLAQSAEHRRAAAGLLESVGAKYPPALELALDAYTLARDDRPDQPNSRRLHAWALARAGLVEVAFEEMLLVVAQHFDANRFPRIEEVLRRDVGLLAAMLGRGKSVKERDAIFARAKHAGAIGLELATSYAVLSWETDASDLDLVGVTKTSTYVSSLNDMTQGYGPELLLLENKPLRLEVHQLERGPAGFALGKVMIFKHDGRGKVDVEDHPFVIMSANARVTP